MQTLQLPLASGDCVHDDGDGHQDGRPVCPNSTTTVNFTTRLTAPTRPATTEVTSNGRSWAVDGQVDVLLVAGHSCSVHGSSASTVVRLARWYASDAPASPGSGPCFVSRGGRDGRALTPRNSWFVLHPVVVVPTAVLTFLALVLLVLVACRHDRGSARLVGLVAQRVRRCDRRGNVPLLALETLIIRPVASSAPRNGTNTGPEEQRKVLLKHVHDKLLDRPVGAERGRHL